MSLCVFNINTEYWPEHSFKPNAENIEKKLGNIDQVKNIEKLKDFDL